MRGISRIVQYSTRAAVTAKPFSEVPAPPRLPLLGHIQVVSSKRFQTDLFGVLNEFRDKYGDVYKIEVPGKRMMVFTFNPEDISTIYKNNGKWPFQPGFESIGLYRNMRRDLFTESLGLLGDQGETWYNIRSKVQQDMMRPKSAFHYIEPLQEIASDFIALLETSSTNGVLPDDTINLLHRWGFESICRIFLDTRVGALQQDAMTAGTFTEKMITNTNVFVKHMHKVLFSAPIWKIYPKAFQWFRELDQAGENNFREAERVIKASIAAIVEKQAKGNAPTDLNEAGLLEKFVRKYGADSYVPMIMAMDGITAGIDTTSHVMAFLMYNLAKNPDKQDTLYEEIVRVVGPSDSTITEANLTSMHYLKAAVRESMRIMPVAPATSRVLEKSVVLSGYEIPPGAFLIMPAANVGLSAENFPEPRKFKPERFLRGRPEYSKHHPFSLFPFGHGARMCIGRRFATLELYLLTIKLLQKYKLEWNVSEEVHFVSDFINKPSRPLNFTLRKR